MANFIVLLGPPGAGKGTQAEVISKEIGIPHISTGDLFRENIRNQTELGKRVKQYLESGALVPDETTIAIVEDRISKPDCDHGALFDGFPRTEKQAAALDEALSKKFNCQVVVVPCINVDKSFLIERVCGRRVCKNGHVFHIKYNPPKTENTCDICGEKLIQRADDNESVIANRIETYEEQTAPLISYYEKKGVLKAINGEQGIKEVSDDILKVIHEAIQNNA